MNSPIERTTHTKYRALSARNLPRDPRWQKLPKELQHGIRVVSKVLPLRTNAYVMDELIDWDAVPDDPIFQLTFLQPDMLAPEDFSRIDRLLQREAPQAEIDAAANEIRMRLSPHPAGQMTANVPMLEGRRLAGLQHKYRQTVLFFPGQGQTCHAYCSFCFRWAQFVGMPEMKFQANETDDLIAYLHAHTEVTDLLITGGDPMIMRTKALKGYLDPILDSGLDHLQNIRIGTKSVAYWPQRYVTDPDADDLLRLLERVVASGRHVAIMGHYSHPRELATPLAQEAVRRIRSTGAEIRMQSPVLKHINDNAAVWTQLWSEGVRLGAIPYYMFVERDTGPKHYFELPLTRVLEIYREAINSVSGLARTVRGPSMSAYPGKVKVDGETTIHGERVFALRFLQARNPDWVGRPFFAQYDEKATWLDSLRPAFGEEKFFFERDAAASEPRRLPIIAST